MAEVKQQWATALVPVAGTTGIALAWYLGTFHYLGSCNVNPGTSDCRMVTAFSIGPVYSPYVLLTTIVATTACAGVAGVLIWRVGPRVRRDMKWHRDFSMVALPCLAAVAIIAGPAMAAAIVDNMPVPGDRRFLEGWVAAFNLMGGVACTLLVAIVVATATAVLRRSGSNDTARTRLGLSLMFTGSVGASLPIIFYWWEHGHPDLPFVDARRPIEAGTWFGILLAASMCIATTRAGLLKRGDILAGLLSIGLVLLAPAVAAPSLYLIVAVLQPLYLADTLTSSAVVSHFVVVVAVIPVFGVGLPILLGTVHAVIMAR